MATTIAPTALLTLEEYLHTSYHPDCDFIDGHLEERSMGGRKHGRLRGRLATWFGINENSWNVYLIVEQRIQVTATRVRIADICLTRRDAPIEEVTLTPPLLCVEVLTLDDRMPRAARVMEDYALMGVPNLWLIDPLDRVAYIYLGAGRFQITKDTLIVPESPIHLDLAALFASLEG